MFTPAIRRWKSCGRWHAGRTWYSEEAKPQRGAVVFKAGRRLGAGDMGVLATVGLTRVPVLRRPAVAILSTGDELVPIEQRVGDFQIRDSNRVILAAQVAAAGGETASLEIAPDQPAPLRQLIGEDLKCDLLLISGGVSVGKYDFAKRALAELGAEFYIEDVAIRPGKPLVFGRLGRSFFFRVAGKSRIGVRDLSTLRTPGAGGP